MSEAPVAVAALQMVSGPDMAENFAVAESLLAQAAARGVQMALLPEYFFCMSPDETAKLRLAEHDGSGPIQHFLADAARRHRMWIIGGTLPLRARSANHVRNACLVFDDQGRHVARYDKLHLFRFKHCEECYDESRTIEAGAEVVTFDGPCGPIGLSVCYDLRFPELYRHMGRVNLIVLPAAFTETTGRAHWEVLLRARAIENQCYVLAAGQGGVHPSGRHTFGHSMLVDPWGDVVDCLPTGPGIAFGIVDPSRIDAVRLSLPALDHRTLI